MLKDTGCYCDYYGGSLMDMVELSFSKDLSEIEKIIDQMRFTRQALEQENKFLKRRVVEIAKSRALAMEKNRLASKKVASIIKQLQEGTK
jgi:hypothetical protein